MSGMMAVILGKEVLDNLRDRRTLVTMAASVLITPMLLLGVLWFISDRVQARADLIDSEPVPLPVVGAEHAPQLMEYLRRHHIEILPPPEDPERAVRDGEHELVLVLGDDFGERLRSGAPAPVRLVRDSSAGNLQALGYRQVRAALQQYSRSLGALRLLARGVDPRSAAALAISTTDVSPPSSRAAAIMTMIPYMLIIFTLLGGLYLAIDSTAGERERGSLEPLLCQPVRRSQIMLAKLLACCLFSAATLALILAALALAFATAPLDTLGISIHISASQAAIIFISCLPFCLLGCALLIAIASFTKTYKEAQSYLGFAMLVPSLPLLFAGMLARGRSWPICGCRA